MLAALDWSNLESYHYLLGAGVVVVVLAVALYALPGGKLKVPGIALSIVGSLGVGVALGIILMGMGFDLKKQEPQGGGEPPPGMGGPPGGMAPMGLAMMRGPGGPGGGGGPNYKIQLAVLINKLDVLTEKPLTVQLSDEQRKVVKEQLTGLADEEELSDDDAKAKFEKLQEVLKDQTPTLEAAGYRWPGAGGGRGGGGFGGGRGGPGGAETPKNPFKTEQNEKHLKDLTDRLGKTQA